MRTLYLHIGTEKTGTTAIQRFLSGNSDYLAANNICYPNFFAHDVAHTGLVNSLHSIDHNGKNLEFYGRSAAECDKDWTRLYSLCAKNKKDVVLSSEHFSSRLRAKGIATFYEKLKPLLGEFVIKVVLYLRRQDTFMLSSYSTAVKAGSAESFEAFTDSQQKQTLRYNYLQLLQPWIDVFGHEAMVVNSYEKHAANNGLLAHFCRIISCSSPPLNSEQARFNDAWPVSLLDIARLVNQSRLKEILGDKRLGFLKNIEDDLPVELKGKSLSLPNSKRQQIHAMYEASNKQIEAQYWQEEAWLSTPPDDSQSDDGEKNVTRIDLLEIMANQYLKQ